jgi:hypothetical protein
MRRLASILLLATPALAEPPAQPCPSINAGWTIPFSGPITSVGYDQTAQMLDVAFGSVMTTFANVPLGVMQGFQNTMPTSPLGNGWICSAVDEADGAANRIVETSGSTTQVIFTHYSIGTTPAAANFATSHTVKVQCAAY